MRTMVLRTLRTGLLLFVALLAATPFVLAAAKEKAPRADSGYPTITEMLSQDKTARLRAIQRYVLTERKLVEQLSQLVHPATGKKVDKELRGSACFLLARMRTTNRKAIASLIAAIEEDFLPPFSVGIPFGIMDPASALVGIGKPATGPVLEALATKGGKKRMERLRWVLQVVEGVDCAIVRLKKRIDKAKYVAKQRRLKASLEYFLDKKKAE